MRNHCIVLLLTVLLFASCTQTGEHRGNPDIYPPGKDVVNWWWEPIFSARGELELSGGAAASTQENYTKYLQTLALHLLDPATFIIDDKWCDLYGDPHPDPVKWPDMRGFIDGYYEMGQRVVLWMKLWDTEGIPQEECILQKGKPIAVDPSNPGYEQHLRKAIRRMLSSEEGCLNASGLMLADISQYHHLEGDIKSYDNLSGMELAKRLLTIIRDEAKKIKPDALLISETVEPALAEKIDMLYLNPGVTPDKSLKESIDSQVEIASEACPGCLLTWGIFPVSNKKEWEENLQIQLLASEKLVEEMKLHDPGKIVPETIVAPMLYYAIGTGDKEEDRFGWNDYYTLRQIRSNYRWKYLYSHPISIRKIRQKTASWSALAPDQIIAQPFIQPIVSSGGYDTRCVKRAVVWLNNEEMSGTFELIDVTVNLQDPTRQAVCYTGKLQPAGNHIWGGNNLVADFTDFQKPGFYFLRIHLDQTIETVDTSPFIIEDNFYIHRASQTGHWYYYERCGVEIPGFHKPCHLNDGILPNGEHRDFTGGWHDGGDYNKWSHYGYYGIIALLELAELEKEFQWTDPSPLPSPVDEADWECKFILKILTPEGHLMSLFAPGPNPWVCLGAPEREFIRMARVEYGRSPQVTAWTAAALASMAIYTKDKECREKYINAAKFLYDIASTRKLDSPDYSVYKNDYLGIQSAFLMTDIAFINLGLEQEEYQKDALMRVERILVQQDKQGFFYTDKERTAKRVLSGYDMIPLYHFLQIPAGHSWKEKITGMFVRWAKFIEPTLEDKPFGQVGSFDFAEGKAYLGTGSISTSFAGWGLATTALLTGEPHYLEQAQQQMSWILGSNPTALSMMAGVGNNPRCFHHRYAAIPPGGKEVLPGGILNGIRFTRKGKPFNIGDLNTQNFVIGDNLPTDYPVLDDDVFGWTWGYGTNEYWTPNSGYFILMACQLERAMKSFD